MNAPRPAREVLRQHWLFFTATATVMLHIADDNFFQPNAGMQASDHLVSGLVPIVLLAGGAAAYPRARSGWQAILALLIGLIALLVGLVEGGYYTVTVGPSGDDFTGLLAAAGGIALFGLAGVTLWRSRKAGRSRPRRYLRRGLFGVLGLLFLTEFYVPFGVSYMSTHVHTAGDPVAHLDAAYEDVSFTTSDGLEISGWYVPSRNGAAVIIPGRTKSQPHARMLIEHGYGVLLFDRRGEGASEGDPTLFGWGGSRDIHAAVEFLGDRPEVDPDRIGGLGLSVSGEMLLHAAAESADLAAVVSEGAGSRSLSEELVELPGSQLVHTFHVLLAKHAGMLLFSNQGPPPRLVDLVPRIAPRPVLLIWAPNGGNAETMNPMYQRLIGSSADIWEIDDAMHVAGIHAHPEEYEDRVITFFDRALLGD